ncbi:MAG: phage holin family protein [Natronospirillum sp.]
MRAEDDVNRHHDSAGQMGNTEGGEGLWREVTSLQRAWRALLSDHVRIAGLETRQAGESLVRILAFGVGAGFLAFTAWVALVGAVAMLLVELNWVSLSAAFFLIAIVLGLCVAGLVMVIRRQSKHLLFSTIAKNLEPNESETPANERSSA